MFQYWWDGDHHTYRKTCSAWWCNLFQFKLPPVPIKVDLNDDMHPCFTLGTPSLLAQLLYQGTGRQPFLQELWSGVLSQMFLAISPCSISLYINKCCQLTYLLLFFFASPCRGWYQILMRHHLESLPCHHIIIQYQWIAYKIVRILDPTIYLYFMYYYILSKLYITTIIIFSIGASCPKPSPNRPCANVPRHHLSVHLQPLPKQPLLFDRMEPS